MKLFLFPVFIASLFIVGCSGQEASYDVAMKQEIGASEAPVTASSPSPGESQRGDDQAGATLASNQKSVIENRLVIRTATVTLRVDSVEKAEKSVQQVVRSYGGYVDNASSSDLDSDHPSLTLSMRVPARAFDEAMTKLEALGIRTSKNIGSQDVTEKVVDMDARLKSMMVQEETYRKLLRAASKLDDVISLQQQLTDVRSNIESLAGQRKSLATQAALSTISLTLTQSAIPNQAPKDPNWLAQSWAEATTSVGGVFRSLAVFAIWLVLFSWLWAPIAWFSYKAIRNAVPKKPPVAARGDF